MSCPVHIAFLSVSSVVHVKACMIQVRSSCFLVLLFFVFWGISASITCSKQVLNESLPDSSTASWSATGRVLDTGAKPTARDETYSNDLKCLWHSTAGSGCVGILLIVVLLVLIIAMWAFPPKSPKCQTNILDLRWLPSPNKMALFKLILWCHLWYLNAYFGCFLEWVGHSVHYSRSIFVASEVWLSTEAQQASHWRCIYSCPSTS